jgi:hypothetical protein
MDVARYQNLWANGDVAVALVPPLTALVVNVAAGVRIRRASGMLRGGTLAFCGVVISTVAGFVTLWAKMIIDAWMSC